ncbi:hypothetical protein A2U01_0070060, partial [Trifolium medium]|nr:hypothetical protein [Trifolium medium]
DDGALCRYAERRALELLTSARRAGEDGASRQSVRRMHQEGSVIGALRSFIRRVAHLHGSSRATRRTGGAARQR